MEKKDLLIIDIGRFFLFSSQLSFNPQKGYLPKEKQFARYPRFEELNVILNKFLNLGEDRYSYENVILLTDDLDETRNLKVDTVHRNYLLWPRNLEKIEEDLELEGLCILKLDERSIYKLDATEEILREIDFLDFEIFKDNLKLIREIGVEIEDVINFFTSTPPLPQQVTDYHKSYILSYIMGTVIAASFDFSHAKHLVVMSEWFKSGYLDKSGFISGFAKQNDLKHFSFDETGIWQLLLNEGKNEFKELQFLNKSVFYPEVTSEKIEKNAKIIDEKGELIKFSMDNDKQLYLQVDSKSYLADQREELYNNILFNSDEIDMRKIKDIDYFGSWYEFYKHKSFNFKELNYIDKSHHLIQVQNDFDDKIVTNEDKNLHYHEFSNFRGIVGEDNIKVIKGQKISEGDVLVQQDMLGGTFFQRLRSKVDGIVYEINYDKKWIVIQSEEEVKSSVEFDYKFLKRFGKNKVQIEITGLRTDTTYISGTSKLARLASIDNFKELPKGAAVWIESVDEIGVIMENFNDYNPSAVILPSVMYEDFVNVMNKYNRYIDLINIIIVNGFGDIPYSYRQRRLLVNSQHKHIFIDPDELSFYILEAKSKFPHSLESFVFYPYVRVYSFDDWNLTGEVIYNDEDSQVVRCDNLEVVDIANYNLFKFNHE